MFCHQQIRFKKVLLQLEQVLKAALAIKAAGSLVFRQEKYQMAMFRFSKAIRLVQSHHVRAKRQGTEMRETLFQIPEPCLSGIETGRSTTVQRTFFEFTSAHCRLYFEQVCCLRRGSIELNPFLPIAV